MSSSKEAMKILVVLAFLITLSLATKPLIMRDLPLQNPDLFEGDILGMEGIADRNAIPGTERRWPGGVIPFIIDRSLTVQTNLIKSAMNHIMSRTSHCIIFKPRTNEKNYIRIFNGENCYSMVGMVNQGGQPLSLGYGCHFGGTILHTLMQAIGFYPEHQRSDRDDYLTIYWDNVKEGMENQFRKQAPWENLLLNKFDYNSIMMYGEYFFSKRPGLKTMVARKAGVRLTEPYEKPGLSHSDVYRIKKLYGCA